jgi:hypothetical protein
MTKAPNPAPALDAAMSFRLHIEHHGHGASDVQRWVGGSYNEDLR